MKCLIPILQILYLLNKEHSSLGFFKISLKILGKITSIGACNFKTGLFASEENRKHSLWTRQKVTETLVYLLDNMYISFGSKL